MQGRQVQSLGWEDPLEEEVAAHSSILAWRIPWTEEPGGLWSVHGVAKSQTRLNDFTTITVNRDCSRLCVALEWRAGKKETQM